MRALMTRAPLLVVCLLVLACGEDAPSTGVDLERPVAELPGWDSLVTDLGLSPNRQDSLARWVETFRTGLDIVRSEPDTDTSLAYEDNWWAEAERSLAALVGPEAVPPVTSWLEARFGRRGAGR